MESFLTSVAYTLGAVGMAGVALVPAHLWSLVVLRRVRSPLPRSMRGMLIAIVVFVPLASSIFVAARTMPRVFGCLSDMRCGPNRAGGLLALAAFGSSVVLAEVIWQMAAVVCGRGQQPNPRLQRTALRAAAEPPGR